MSDQQPSGPVPLHPEDPTTATANPLLYPGDLESTALFAADVLIVLSEVDFDDGVPTGFPSGVHRIVEWVSDSLRRQVELEEGKS